MSQFQPRKGDAVRLIIAGTMDEEWDYVPEHILVRDYDGRLHIVKKNIAHLVPARISQRDADIADAIDADDDAEDNGGWYERGERPPSGRFIPIFNHDTNCELCGHKAHYGNRCRELPNPLPRPGSRRVVCDCPGPGDAVTLSSKSKGERPGRNFYVPTSPTEPNNGEEG